MLKMTPYLLFQGNCAEAMEFYRECFGGSLTLIRLGDTPMKAQAQGVLDLTRKHNDVHFLRWRQVQVPFADLDASKLKAAADAIDDLEAEVVKRQRAHAEPQPHKFELKPAK